MDRLSLPEIVGPVPSTDAVFRRDLVYAARGERFLKVDILTPTSPRGTVLLVHGEPVLEEGGCFWGEDRGIKDTGPLQSWMRLLAANGLIAVSFNRRSSCGFTHPGLVDEDLDSLVTFLDGKGVPCDQLGMLAFSGGTPFALSLSRRDRRVRALVTMYGPLNLADPVLTQWFPGMAHPASQGWDPCLATRPPANHLHVWPLNDWIPNGAFAYARHAAAKGFSFELERHPAGGHGFDFVNDDQETRRIISRIVAFLRENLSSANRAQSRLFGDNL